MNFNNNPFDIKNDSKLWLIYESLGKENIKEFKPFEFLLTSINYITHEITTNVNSKILYLIVDYQYSNNEGIGKVITFDRLVNGTFRFMYWLSISSGSTITAFKNYNFLTSRVQTSGNQLSNALSCIQIVGFKIILK